jgi:hypothetical protein
MGRMALELEILKKATSADFESQWFREQSEFVALQDESL